MPAFQAMALLLTELLHQVNYLKTVGKGAVENDKHYVPNGIIIWL